MGFDEFIGFRQGHWNRYFDPLLEDRGQMARPQGFISDILTSEAIRFASESAAGPFFLYLAFNAPHAPYQLPGDLFDKYRAAGLPPEIAAVYGLVENVDANIGRLLGALAKGPRAADTAVFFLTDNGPQTDRFNGRLRGRKASVYEGGIRTPLLVRWPGKATAGAKIDRIAAHIDVMPTVLDLCGVKPPAGVELDGRSFKPLLTNPRAAWPGRSLYSHYETPANPGSLYPGAVRTQRWKMVNGAELYDLNADPGESTNLAAKHPEQLERLAADYEGWFRGVTTARSFQVPPIPAGHPRENPARLYAPQTSLREGARFHNKNGFAHDWIVDLGEASWRIQTIAAGQYEIGLRCLSPGVPVEVRIGTQTIRFDLAPARSMEPIALPDQVARREAAEMPWEVQILGVLRLEAGPQEVIVRGAKAQVKELLLRRLN
jgi:arylsulfatase A